MRRLLRKLSYTITESGVIWRLYWVSWRNALHQFRDIDVERHRQTVKGIAGNNGGCRIAVDPAQGTQIDIRQPRQAALTETFGLGNFLDFQSHHVTARASLCLALEWIAFKSSMKLYLTGAIL